MLITFHMAKSGGRFELNVKNHRQLSNAAMATGDVHGNDHDRGDHKPAGLGHTQESRHGGDREQLGGHAEPEPGARPAGDGGEHQRDPDEVPVEQPVGGDGRRGRQHPRIAAGYPPQRHQTPHEARRRSAAPTRAGSRTGRPAPTTAPRSRSPRSPGTRCGRRRREPGGRRLDSGHRSGRGDRSSCRCGARGSGTRGPGDRGRVTRWRTQRRAATARPPNSFTNANERRRPRSPCGGTSRRRRASGHRR